MLVFFWCCPILPMVTQCKHAYRLDQYGYGTGVTNLLKYSSIMIIIFIILFILSNVLLNQLYAIRVLVNNFILGHYMVICIFALRILTLKFRPINSNPVYKSKKEADRILRYFLSNITIFF